MIAPVASTHRLGRHQLVAEPVGQDADNDYDAFCLTIDEGGFSRA